MDPANTRRFGDAGSGLAGSLVGLPPKNPLVTEEPYTVVFVTLPARAAFDWCPPIRAAACVWSLRRGRVHGLRLGGAPFGSGL